MRRFCRCFVLFTLLNGWINVASAQVVNMPDANLRAAVRDALGLGSNARITKQKMRELTELRAPNSQIRDLTGLEHATQLTRLDLQHNQIRDLGPLTDLKKLWTLALWENQIRDIRPLAGLTNLTVLYLTGNQIRDITPITGLTKLSTLSLGSNTPEIRDITPLARLKQLKWLKLSGNQISNVSPLTRLVNLETLWLRNNPIQDAFPLASLTKLTEVDIEIPTSPRQVVSIPDPKLAAAVRKALGLGPNVRITQQAMQGLTELYAYKRQITNITGLEHATQLKILSLWNNQISDLRPLTGLTRLTSLDIRNNQISDLRTLTGLTRLTRLDMGTNRISDITPLTELTQLRRLYFGRNQIRSLQPLARLAQLRELYSVSNQINDITPLARLAQLRKLVLWGNQISDISPLTKLKNLSYLDLGANHISSIQALAGLTELTELYFGGNKVTDITPLKNLTKLERLFLKNNPIEDMTPLRTLLNRNPDLELDVDSNQLSVVQVSASQRPPIYWVDTAEGTLHRLRGATVEHLLLNMERATSLALDAASGKLYWTMKINSQQNDRRGRIRLANLNGTNHRILKDLTHVPHGIALDVESDKIYLTNASGKIQEINFDGSNFQPNFITGLNSPKDIAIDRERGQLYWTESDSIWRADFNGNNREEFAPNLGELGSITIAGGKIYSIERPGGEQRWQIRSSTFDGLTPPQTLVTLQSRPMGLAVDTAGEKLYWTSADGKIQRADLNGENIQDVVTGLKAPGDIVLGISTRTNPAAPGNTSLVTRQLPEETLLLANYPNPFNPETWIPYQLATDTDVQLLIYDAHGSIVRRLVLGHQRAGSYTDRSQAAYWDGRNAFGERVASGLYFYQLQTDNVSSLRKMLILK